MSLVLLLSMLLVQEPAAPGSLRRNPVEVPAPPVIRQGPPVPRPPAVASDGITAPIWLSTPSKEDVNRRFPEGERRVEKAGRAVIRCQVRDDGALEACKVVSEVPADWQFGKAAMELIPLFRLAPQDRDGRPTAGKTITIPFMFPLN